MGKYPARNKPIQTLQTARNRIFSSQYAAKHILWWLIAETSHATGRHPRIAGKSQIKQLQPDKSQYLCLYVLKKMYACDCMCVQNAKQNKNSTSFGDLGMPLWMMLIISLPVRAVASTDDDTGFCQVLSPKMLGSLWNHFGIVMIMGKVCQQWDNSRITWGNVEILRKLYGFFHPFPYLARFFAPSPPAPSRSRQPHQGLPGNRGCRRVPCISIWRLKWMLKIIQNSWNLSQIHEIWVLKPMVTWGSL